MARTGIYTSITDTQLGNQSVSDSIFMLVAPAKAATATGGLKFDLGVAYLITSVKDATNLGITSDNNLLLMFNITEFYEKAGNGTKLWIVGVNATETTSDATKFVSFITDSLPEVIQSTTATNFDNRPRVVGFCGYTTWAKSTASDPVIPTVTQDIVKAAQTTLENLFTDSIRMCGVVDGLMLNCKTATGIMGEQLATTLTSCVSLNCPRIGIQITTSTPGSPASVGQTLGWLAGISLATSIGAVMLGSVSQMGYFIDYNAGTPVNTNVAVATRAINDELGDKQYIFTRTRPQLPGVYFNDGATCNDPTMALSSLEFLRVGNAICDSAEAFFVRLLGSNITTTANGEIDNGYKASTLDDLYSRYLAPRINRGEAQEINVDFWAKDGDFLASRAIEVQIEIRPYASLREVYIETLFIASQN
jgi:hypothetical protein